MELSIETLTKPISLTDIAYPVFRIGSERPLFEEGVVLYVYVRKDESSFPTYYIIDDRTLEGKTLAERRIALLRQGIKMKKLGKAVFFLGDLVKLANSSTWFIDSMGAVFQYKKKTSVKLTYRSITKVIPIPSGGAMLEIKDIPGRFKCLFTPSSSSKYAGVLKHGLSYILYDISDTKYDDTRRLI